MRSSVANAHLDMETPPQSLRFARPSYREVIVDGVCARYLYGGCGPHLLLIASPLLDAATYLPTIRRLCRSYTVVCVELPGSGGSTSLAEPWSEARYAAWVLEFVRHLPLAAPVVVGHAASVPIAAELARIAPGEISGVVPIGEFRATLGFGLRAARGMLRNAVRHRAVFASHVKRSLGAERLLGMPRRTGSHENEGHAIGCGKAVLARA